MSGTFINIPAKAGQQYKDGVATASDLPLTGNADGDLRVVVDEHAIYIWNDGTQTWDNITGSGSSGSLVVDIFTLNAGQITAKSVTLSNAPVTPNKTVFDPEGGPIQRYTSDFTISGSTLSWNGLTLDGVLEAGDRLIIIHD